jgi:hypothetical protein
MAQNPRLIVQAARGGAVDEQMRREPPPSVTAGDVIVESLPAGAEGRLDAPAGGEVVLSVLAPDALVREREEVARVLDGAGTGTEPLVVIVEAAEELREEHLEPVVEAARRSSRPVILRIEMDA